jgi:flagellar assembly factor FliW
MKTVKISKRHTRDYLAEELTKYLLQSEETDIYDLVRFDGIEGFEKINDQALFNRLADSVPEFKLVEIQKSDTDFIILALKKDYQKEGSEEILVDLNRIIQMKFLG